MTWTGDGRHDPETVLLPVVPPAGGPPPGYQPPARPLTTGGLPVVPADATVVLPAFQGDLYTPANFGGVDMDAPTQVLPVITDGMAPPVVEEGAESVARNSAVMAVGSIISRITGFLRTAALAAALGAVAVADNYNLANTLPNMVYELLLGGVLASVIIPLLVRARRQHADRGEAYTQRLLSAATVFLAGATVVAVAAAPLLTLLMANTAKPNDQHLITVFSYLLLPEIFFYGMAGLLAAVLNTRGHFAAPTFTPILNNIVVMLTAVVFIALPSVYHPPTVETITTLQIAVIGVGTTLGIVIQAAGLVPALRKVGFRWKWRWDWRSLGLRELGRISSWMLLYVVVSQIGLFIMLNLAKRAGSQGGPGPAIFDNAYLIFMMAHGIAAVSIMTALMPRMAAAASEKRYRDVASQLSLGVRLSSVILIPASVAYLILGRQLAVTLFQWHSYTNENAIRTGWVVAAAGLGLVPFAVSQLQLFAFYAMPDTKTPALLNIAVVTLRVLLDLFLYGVVLAATWVAAGLMFGNAVSFVFSAIVGYWLLRKRIGRLGLTDLGRSLGRLTGAALIAAVPTLLVAMLLEHFLGLGKLGSFVGLVVGGLVLVAVYLAAAVLLRAREVNQVWTMVRGRLGR
jgi:putative peptidoglycan lipid II flippase